MVTLVEMDPTITLSEQMQDRGGPVVLINSFKVRPDEVDQLLSAWTADATLMRAQPGYISTQLHRGIGGSCVFLNYAVWESTEHFARAFANPEFQSQLGHYPSSATSEPHLFRKLAVAGVCVE
jgi:heme-degrading monooxygenase HmoA